MKKRTKPIPRQRSPQQKPITKRVKRVRNAGGTDYRRMPSETIQPPKRRKK